MKKIGKLTLKKQVLRNLSDESLGQAAGGEFTFACSDNPCDTGFRDCTIDYNDTFGPECEQNTLTANCPSNPNTFCS